MFFGFVIKSKTPKAVELDKPNFKFYFFTFDDALYQRSLKQGSAVLPTKMQTRSGSSKSALKEN